MAEPLMKDVSSVQGQSQSLRPLETLVVGRIDKVSRVGDAYSTLITSPAPDTYSMPSKLDVQSAERLGNVGDEIKFIALAKGIPNSFRTAAGELVHTARHFFNFVRFVR